MGFSRQEHWGGLPFPSPKGTIEGKKGKSCLYVWLFASPWTVAYQTRPSKEFSRQEYWSGLPFPFPSGIGRVCNFSPLVSASPNDSAVLISSVIWLRKEGSDILGSVCNGQVTQVLIHPMLSLSLVGGIRGQEGLSRYWSMLPWRRSDTSKVKLFFLPSLMHWFSIFLAPNLCWNFTAGLDRLPQKYESEFLQRRHTDDQKRHEKMLNTTNY